MDPRLNQERARTRHEELLRLAQQRRAAPRRAFPSIRVGMAAIGRRAAFLTGRQAAGVSSVDVAAPSDEITLRATRAPDPALIADAGGVPVVAVSIADGSIRALSDELPLELLELAQMRASQLRQRPSSGGREPSSRRHFRRRSDPDGAGDRQEL
jgi:hypothetical protein